MSSVFSPLIQSEFALLAKHRTESVMRYAAANYMRTQ